ncbi:GAF domain-containing protein [Nocardia sp. ET3-3]|uniref:GAF domain-containing protein n=1 Tax=Nocardia terrae TaxID=2675851 RepID=A0A7K1UWX5_9NOCA|nr:GAF domain-containing protein [Nocardia terrae]MVU78781.1 GAF domain-containing protein [Nocardia terrae]
MAAPVHLNNRLRRAPTAQPLSRMHRFAVRAEQRAARRHSEAVNILASEQQRMHQHRIDAEVADTERTISDLLVPERTHYPDLEVLDPYFLAGADRQTMLTRLLDTAVEHSHADMGTIHLYDPERSELRMAAQRGFDGPFLTFFDRIEAASGTAWAAATGGASVFVPDVEHSTVFDAPSREVVLEARVRSVRSIPLITPTGPVVGVLSCYYEKPYPPMEDNETLLVVLADAAARSLIWRERRGSGTGPHVA